MSFSVRCSIGNFEKPTIGCAGPLPPYGLILGARRYLVAKVADDMGGAFRHFRLDRIVEAAPLEATFEMETDFDIRTHARRAFGAFRNDEQYGGVIRRFDGRATEQARSFSFHPEQTFEDQLDESLVVRFRAAGWLDMCWRLYQWGDTVEVVEPQELRSMVEGHRRSDFAEMPPCGGSGKSEVSAPH